MTRPSRPCWRQAQLLGPRGCARRGAWRSLSARGALADLRRGLDALARHFGPGRGDQGELGFTRNRRVSISLVKSISQ